MNWKQSLVKLGSVSFPYVDDYAKLACHTVNVVVGCLDQHLRRRHALDCTKQFIKQAHGNVTPAARAEFKELYREFEQWIEDDK